MNDGAAGGTEKLRLVPVDDMAVSFVVTFFWPPKVAAWAHPWSVGCELGVVALTINVYP